LLDRDSTGREAPEAAAGPPPAGPRVCPSCHAPLSPAHRFCPACGTPTAAGVVDEGRFRAGALFANRFRIVAALGHGGMGEVYRAHDLELGQPVALKFLTAFRSDTAARARLRTEVRLARQIAHPNVCRVYDIGEAHGELYLSMEYVDGEDLAALLRRIGRLPMDKGIEIARKLCAGLAAAHAKSVLHRDFKPANIMIDSAGEFGSWTSAWPRSPRSSKARRCAAGRRPTWRRSNRRGVTSRSRAICMRSAWCCTSCSRGRRRSPRRMCRSCNVSANRTPRRRPRR
jgi:hypothetical protein